MRFSVLLALIAGFVVTACQPSVNPAPAVEPSNVSPPVAAATPSAEPAAPAPSGTPVALSSAATAPPTTVPVAMPSAGDVRAARALRCSTRRSGSGCTDAGGTVVVPFEYEGPVVFKESGLARVFRPDRGWAFINARNETVFEPFLFDNGPDPIEDGLARIRKDGKIGFVDSEWRLVIAPQYDAAYGFDGGKARVCVGCDPRLWSKDAPPEAEARPGRQFLIDRGGNEVRP